MNGSSTLDPHSPHAQAIFNLFVVATIVFGLIFVIVGGGIFYSILRFRWREGELDPKQIAGNRRVEIIWTAIPFLIVCFLFFLTMHAMGVADPPPAPTPDLIVTGHQFWWEATYPASGVVVANEIHVPTGKEFSVQLESKDVLHEFWVAELTRKMTTVPGSPNHIWLRADKAGTYLGLCSEFCGAQHAWMRFVVVAEEPVKFEAWQNAQRRPAAPPTSDAAVKGLVLFEQTSCVSCHAVRGTTAVGNVAPDLTHVASRTLLGAGILENTPANLRRWIADPQRFKPGALMPAYKLSDEQLDELTAYFQTLK